MSRPTLEVADILRAQGDRFLDRYRSSFDFQQLKAFRAIQRCRTAALGGHPGCVPALRTSGHLLQLLHYGECFLLESAISVRGVQQRLHAPLTPH